MHYRNALLGVCARLEETYGLARETENGKDLSELNIREVLAAINEDLDGANADEVAEINIEAFKHVGLLSHISARVKFFEQKQLSFSKYPSVSELKESLEVFFKLRTLNKETRNKANIVAAILDEIDETNLALRFDRELEYKLLRLFLILVRYSDYADASVVAEYIWFELGGDRDVNYSAGVRGENRNSRYSEY